MTNEEKARAYDEALKRAKAAIDIAADKDLVGGVVRTILPELYESEDERIRKAIIGIIKNSNIIDINVSEERMIAYLEKQKEQKPVERSREDNYIIGFVYALLNQIEWKDNWSMSKEECLRRLNNYIPQKLAEVKAEEICKVI